MSSLWHNPLLPPRHRASPTRLLSGTIPFSLPGTAPLLHVFSLAPSPSPSLAPYLAPPRSPFSSPSLPTSSSSPHPHLPSSSPSSAPSPLSDTSPFNVPSTPVSSPLSNTDPRRLPFLRHRLTKQGQMKGFHSVLFDRTKDLPFSPI